MSIGKLLGLLVRLWISSLEPTELFNKFFYSDADLSPIYYWMPCCEYVPFANIMSQNLIFNHYKALSNTSGIWFCNARINWYEFHFNDLETRLNWLSTSIECNSQNPLIVIYIRVCISNIKSLGTELGADFNNQTL